jgi:hypothetical protein
VPQISSPRPRRALLGLIGLLSACLAPHDAGAQRLRYQFGAPGTGLPGQGEYGADILAPAQIEACLRRWQELNAMADAIERDQARVETLEAELAAPQPAPARGRAPRGMAPAQSAASSVSPQQAAAERQAKMEALNAERRRYLEAVERYRGAAEGFNFGCALRRYYEADMQAAHAWLGTAAR